MASLVAKVLIGGFVAIAMGQAIGSHMTASQNGGREPFRNKTPPAQQSEPTRTTVSTEAENSEAKKIADGTHCVNGWDDSFPPLKSAVKEELRNPKSFEHVRTVWSPVGKDGKFGLVMTYRAQNGFGGMNVENVGALVDAKTCQFQIASARTLTSRLGS